MSASSVSARVARITGQTPPMSASAISSAASDFIRRSSRIALSSSLVAATARAVSFSSAAKCASGSASRMRRERAGSPAARSQRNGEPSARPVSSASTLGDAASSFLSALPGSRGRSPPAIRRRGPWPPSARQPRRIDDLLSKRPGTFAGRLRLALHRPFHGAGLAQTVAKRESRPNRPVWAIAGRRVARPAQPAIRGRCPRA